MKDKIRIDGRDKQNRFRSIYIDRHDYIALAKTFLSLDEQENNKDISVVSLAAMFFMGFGIGSFAYYVLNSFLK
jgi:hypothetical protein